MVSTKTRKQIEESCGRVPSWIENLAEPAADHSWALVRDLEFGETDLSPREKALIGVGVAAAIGCQYCVHFHTADARMQDATEAEIAEAANLAGVTKYFSTILHGAEVDMDDFVAETSAMVEHIEAQQAEAGAD